MSKINTKLKQPTLQENIVVDKGIHRNTMIEMGMYNIHQNKVEKSGKQYSRKVKHRGRDNEN